MNDERSNVVPFRRPDPAKAEEIRAQHRTWMASQRSKLGLWRQPTGDGPDAA